MAQDVEALAWSVLELLRWIPGIRRLSLCRLLGEPRRYLMTMSFADEASYASWRRVEEEAADYWERFAAVLMQWEQLCRLVEEYVGEGVMDVGLGESVGKD
jgi:hypothetical protein